MTVSRLEELVGRSEVAAQVASLIAEHPLVSLVGPGGVGKTSLATALAADLAAEYPGGTHVVELASARSDDDVGYLCARAIGVETLDAVLLRAEGTPTLVVLDNCETALDGARHVAEALAAGGDLRVLATTRSPLRTSAEFVTVLEPLDVPGVGHPRTVVDSPAAELFVQRAKRAGASWEVDDHNLAAIARIVRRLDGVPLAIELAAARSRLLTPPELVEHLDAQLDLLSRPGDETDRHRSLRVAIGSSYEPLAPELQELLRHLAVIPGAFDLALARRVAAPGDSEIEMLDRIGALVDVSLVDARPDGAGHTGYRLLDSIRAFAWEELERAGEGHDANEAFVDAMVTVAEEILIDGSESFSASVLDRIRTRYPHLVAAITWCLEHDETAGRAYRLILPMYGPTGARLEAAALALRVSERWTEPAPLRAEALAVMGTINFVAAGYDDCRRLSELALADPDASDLAHMVAFRTLGMMAATQDRLDEARVHLESGLAAAEAFPGFHQELKISWSAACLDQNDRPAVKAQLIDIVAATRASREEISLVWALATLLYHRMLDGEVEAAVEHAAECIEVADRSGVPWAMSTARRVAAEARVVHGGWDAGLTDYRESLEICVSGGDLEGLAMLLRSASGAARWAGDEAAAVALWQTIAFTEGMPVLRSVFHEHQEALREELGRPTASDVVESARAARSLLEPIDANAAVAAPSGRVDRFETFEIDRQRHELRNASTVVHVEPQVFDVLVYLVDRAGELVTKNDLLDNVWGDRFVSEAALSSRIAFARKALGDDGKQQRLIRTVHGRGFMFVGALV